MKVKVQTRPCMVCGQHSELTVDKAAYERWALHGELIQVAMPDMTTDERELLMTGTHSECWDNMIADDEEE